MPTNNSINSQDPIEVAKGGTGVSTLTTANGILAAGNTALGAIQNIGTGSAGQVLTSNGTSLPSFQAAGGGSGKLVQQVRAAFSGFQNIINQIPLDDTIPQNTEGDEILSVTITPTNVNSILVIDAVVFGLTGGNDAVYAIFQDSTVNALFATASFHTNNRPGTTSIQAYITAGTTSATTIKLRAGYSVPGGSLCINGDTSRAFFGGGTIPNTTLFVTEFSP